MSKIACEKNLLIFFQMKIEMEIQYSFWKCLPHGYFIHRRTECLSVAWPRVATIGFHRLKILKTKWKNIYVKSTILFKLIVTVQSEQNNSCAGSSRPTIGNRHLCHAGCGTNSNFSFHIQNGDNKKCDTRNRNTKFFNWNYGMEFCWMFNYSQNEGLLVMSIDTIIIQLNR